MREEVEKEKHSEVFEMETKHNFRMFFKRLDKLKKIR